MFTQTTISRAISTILADGLHSKTAASLSNSVLGLITSQDATIHSIGRGLAEATGKSPKHTIKQVDRMLSNANIRVEDLSEDLILSLIGARKEIYVILDWTEFDKDKQSTIVLSLATKHGRATPLIWMTVDKNDLKGKRNHYEDQVLIRFHDILPKDIKVTLLADRGFFSRAFVDAIENDFHWDYVVRIRGNILVKEYGEEKHVSDLVQKGQYKLIKDAKITKDGYEVNTLVVEWDKDMKEPWCLVSNKKVYRAKKIVICYSKRWPIEPTFRDAKNPKFGFGMKATRINSTERRDRLWLVIVLSIVVLTTLGAASEKLGYDRRLKANTVKKRTYSLFRQGLILWRLNFPPDDLNLLFKTFEELFYKAIPSSTQLFDFI